jgi:hypothetical protein
VTGLPLRLEGRSLAAAAAPALTAVAALVVFAAASGRLPVELLLVATGGIALAGAALARPRAALVVGLVVIACVPVYYGRYVGGTKLGITPVAVVSLLLLPLALRESARFRVRPLDVAVLAFVALRSLSYVLNFEGAVGLTALLLLVVLLPYAVFRVLLLMPGALRLASWALAAAAVPLCLVALQEGAGTPNPFFTWVTPVYQANEWAKVTSRLSEARVEASFGHPIAFGMYLALVVLLLLALALTAGRAWQRAVCFAAMPLALVALVLTLSRGPMLMLVVALPLFLLSQASRLDPRRLRAVLLSGLALGLVVVQSSGTLSALREDSSGTSTTASSAQFRLQILDIVRDPSQFSLLGQASDSGAGVTEAVYSRVGVLSVDNAYALLYLASGALVLLAFLVVAALVWRTAVGRGLDALQRAWAVSIGVALLNLLTVNLLTNYADLFWIGVAAVAATAQSRVSRETPAPEPPPPPARSGTALLPAAAR